MIFRKVIKRTHATTGPREADRAAERQDRQARGLPGHDEEEQLYAQVQDRQTLRHPPDAEGEAPRLEPGADPHVGRHSVIGSSEIRHCNTLNIHSILLLCLLQGSFASSWPDRFQLDGRSHCSCNDSIQSTSTPCTEM